MEKYRGDMYYADRDKEAYEAMVNDLCTLNIKYLQQLLTDLRDGYLGGRYGAHYHQDLQNRVELSILERTVLK